MARAAIPTSTSTTKGVKRATAATGDTVNGHYLANSGRERLHVKNTGASAYTVTIKFNKTVDGQSVADYVKSIPAGESWTFGPFDTENYGTQVLIDVNNAAITLDAVA